MEALVTQADVRKPFDRDCVKRVMEQKEEELLSLYRQKHMAIQDRVSRLEELVFRAGHWWLDAPELAVALRQVRAFIDNIDHNFGGQSPAWRLIQSVGHRARRKQQLVEALMNYRGERDAWDGLF